MTFKQPTPAEILATREAAGLTQTEAAALVHAPSYRTWQNWELGEREMDPAKWELFLIKTVSAERAVPASSAQRTERVTPDEIYTMRQAQTRIWSTSLVSLDIKSKKELAKHLGALWQGEQYVRVLSLVADAWTSYLGWRGPRKNDSPEKIAKRKIQLQKLESALKSVESWMHLPRYPSESLLCRVQRNHQMYSRSRGQPKNELRTHLVNKLRELYPEKPDLKQKKHFRTLVSLLLESAGEFIGIDAVRKLLKKS